MNEEYVIIPKSQLDKLEVARQALYDFHKDHLSTSTLVHLSSISQPMWLLTHTVWPKYEPGFVPEIDS